MYLYRNLNWETPENVIAPNDETILSEKKNKKVLLVSYSRDCVTVDLATSFYSYFSLAD